MSSGQQVQSALINGPFPTRQVGYVFSNVSVKGKPSLYPALSVGKQGVTPQLEGVAQQQGDGDKKLVTPGQIVLNSRSDRRGASGLSDYEGVVSVVYTVLQPNLDFVFPRFAHHLFRCVAFQEEYYRWGTGIVDDLWSTNFDRLAQIRIPLPDLDTQRRIADYLDTEVGEMDAMVARLETLIADLEARRKAVITEMVATVDAPRLPMGMFSKFISGRDWSAVEATDGNYPVYGSGGVIGWANDYMYDGESIIFGRKGTLDKPRLAIGKYWVIDTAYIAIPNNDLDVGFFYYWATTLPYDFLSTQTALPSMTSADLKAQKIPLPDLDTQRRIVAELDEETAAIDGIIARSHTLIDDLKARKSALITEVVTGRKQV